MTDGNARTGELVDLTKLRRRFDDDEELIAEILRVFQSEVPGRQAGFAEALAAGDFSRLTHLAHSLKGVAGTMFAEPLRQAAFDLEMAARAGDATEIRRLAAAMRAVLEATSAHVGGLARS